MSDYPQQFWFCHNCGRQNQLSFKHCTECGTALPSQQAYAARPIEPHAIKKAAGIGLGGIFIISGIIGAIILFGSIMVIQDSQSRRENVAKQLAAMPSVSVSPTAKIVQQATPEAPSKASIAEAHVQEFNATLSAPEIQAYMADAKLSALSADDLVVTVTARWHYEPKSIRIQMAQMIWKAWAGIHSPGKPDTARLTLKDAAGNSIGGSRVWAGSMIWVDD